MTKPIVCIEGSSGTVGLSLAKRLAAREDIRVVELTSRSTPDERKHALESADVAVLCLPEVAARAFVAAAPKGLRILDASPAHRTTPGWVYGLPELDGTQKANIRRANRVANPGCYATGAILLLKPIFDARAASGVAKPGDRPPQVAITAVGGVSAGGRAMMESQARDPFGYRLFGLDQAHRHIPEIQQYAGLAVEPIFMPAVAAHVQGTLVQIPFDVEHLGLSYSQVVEILSRAYSGNKGVKVVLPTGGQRFVDAAELAATDNVQIQVLTDAEQRRIVLLAQFDNLGRGAAGAAEKNLELMLGLGD